jgi:AcrR family transcriptional regulator
MTVDDGRTRLREAALNLFGRQGVRGTSTRAILDAAGMKNPSAISYHFGSKAELVDELVNELITEAWPVIQLQVDLAADRTPTVAQWAGVAASSAAELISTERGCLLARIWWEYDCWLFPDAFDDFLGSDLPLSLAWHDAVRRTFPDDAPLVALGRNLVVLRTLQWLIARRAGRLLADTPTQGVIIKDPTMVRNGLFETAMAFLTGPTRLTGDDMTFDQPGKSW